MEVIEKKRENIIMLIASAYIVIVSLTSGSCNLKHSIAAFQKQTRSVNR